VALVFLNGFDPCKGPGHSVFPFKWKQGGFGLPQGLPNKPNGMGIGNENDQA
jgi:hypothetical protein